MSITPALSLKMLPIPTSLGFPQAALSVLNLSQPSFGFDQEGEFLAFLANLNHTAQALIISGSSIAAYFITVNKTVKESARRNSRAQFEWPDLAVVQRFQEQQ
ncbi:Uncharacterized protein TCM_011250 [Theobroma cacao]|uniref:Uncharacterized protein n=1 Tax=Theobroma cacao TaxID=3641 RepID=A0A061EAA4_THECC|nr:Uncharacterized protein TCM_011250 [Theobroma cacao]